MKLRCPTFVFPAFFNFLIYFILSCVASFTAVRFLFLCCLALLFFILEMCDAFCHNLCYLVFRCDLRSDE